MRLHFAWQLGLVLAAVLLVTGSAHVSSALDEFQKIKPNDLAGNDNFGYSAGISGNTAILGSWRDDASSMTDDDTGSAYIFRNPGSGAWAQLDKLTANDAAAEDRFGNAVAISGNTAIVGAPHDNSNRGSAYIFRDNGAGDWLQIDKLTALIDSPGELMGFSVAINGNTAIIGAQYGNTLTGAAYIFRDNGAGDWQQLTKLTPNDGTAGDEFGYSVAISGTTALVGAHFDSNAGGGAAGSVYVFQENAGAWTQTTKLFASDPADGKRFGESVAFSGNTAVVGAIGDAAGGAGAGAAYVFQRDGASWQQRAKLTASDGAAGDQFGFSVGIDGNVAIVGANKDADGSNGTGSAYLFRTNSVGSWNQLSKLRASDRQLNDTLGTAVGVSGATALAGAPLVDVPNDGGAGYLFAVPAAGVPGDFNQNGRVDVADYAVWRNTINQTGASLPADGNGDGVVNVADYQLWRRNFGLAASGSGFGASDHVPEPASAAILVLAAGLFACQRGRRRDVTLILPA